MHTLRSILLMVAPLLVLAACSSDGTIEKEQVIDTRTPMVFGATTSVTAKENTASSAPAFTRAALETVYDNFKVSAWKAFGQGGQQNVMNGYKVQGSAASGGGTYKWDYEGIVAGGQTQVLRYWDLSAFPYEFRAVAPYLDGATITPEGLTINATFQAQEMLNDVYTPPATAAEPCVVAHVSRVHDATSYADTDGIKQTEINAAAKADGTRSLLMPFHHLMSKIGFRIYIDNPQPSSVEHIDDYKIFIEDVEITVQNATDGFITKSTTYTATNTQGLQKGVFSGNTTTMDEFKVLDHKEYHLTTQNLHYHLNKEQAFDMTPDCLLQIPQGGVKVHVKMKIHTNHVEPEEQNFYYDSWLSLDKANTAGDTFTWEPGNKYIYYLHIPNLHGHEIFLNTCEVLPWDEVQTTDIPIEL